MSPSTLLISFGLTARAECQESDMAFTPCCTLVSFEKLLRALWSRTRLRCCNAACHNAYLLGTVPKPGQHFFTENEEVMHTGPIILVMQWVEHLSGRGRFIFFFCLNGWNLGLLSCSVLCILDECCMYWTIQHKRQGRGWPACCFLGGFRVLATCLRYWTLQEKQTGECLEPH